MSNQQPTKTRPPANRTSSRPTAPPPKRQPAYYAPPRRDPFPYVIGGFLALLVVGVFLVVFMLSSNSGTTTADPPASSAQSSQASTDLGVVQPGVSSEVNPAGSTDAGSAATGSTPPTLPVLELKAMLDDPAKSANLLIIDTRALETYDQGHIKGAESWPEGEIDAKVVKLPKDKFIVAYCACPSDSGATRVVQKLHDTYGFNYDTTKVLLGGWQTWMQENAKDASAFPVEPVGAK